MSVGWLLPLDDTTERIDLHKLVDKLDSNEVQIVTQYIANLLLAGAAAAKEKAAYNGPRC